MCITAKIILSIVLATVAFIDIKTMTIPTVLQVLPLLFAPLNTQWELKSALLGIAVSGGLLFVASMIKENAFGGGDIKLLASLGYVLGYDASVFGLFAACLLSLIPCIYFKITKTKEGIPFGPFIAVGYIASMFLFL